ncbi:MAG: hypothetical protein AB8H86_01855 [Polyangiales bacterium]
MHVAVIGALLLMSCATLPATPRSPEPASPAGAERENEGLRVIQMEEIAIPCPEPSTYEVHQVTPVENAIMPEAVGVWMARCVPGRWAFMRQQFVYDGRYVTVVYAPMNLALEFPPRYSRSADDTYRLESRWEARTLWVRLPAGDWVEFAHFGDGRFVWRDEHHVLEHAREGRLEERSLIVARAPHDYEAAARSDQHRQIIGDSVVEAVRGCPYTRFVSGTVTMRLDGDGNVVGAPLVQRFNPRLATCIRNALINHHVEGYPFEGWTSYLVPLTFSPE